MKTSHNSRLWPRFFFAAALESFVAIGVLLLIPSEAGLSLARLGMLGILALFGGAGAYLGFHPPWSPERLARTSNMLIAVLVALASSAALFLLRYLDPDRLLPVYQRLAPLLLFFAVVGAQSVVVLLVVRNGFNPDELAGRYSVYRAALPAFAALLLLLTLVASTRLGITKDPAYWGEPGVAILGWQTALGILVGLAVLVHASKSADSGRTMGLVPFAIWVLAVVLWLGVPVSVLQNSFYAPITPPAYQPFPYSDAGFYDYLSQSLLIGTEYLGEIPPRPMYVLFLSCLHAVFGQDYVGVIAAQTSVLALFPVALYLLGKQLHSSAAGATIALMATFRELTSLWISSNTRIANSKILTSDLPTALGIAWVCLVAIYWLRRRDLISALLLGGSFGVLLLLRTQSLIILPVLFLMAWFAFGRRTRPWLVSVMVASVAVAVTIAPWLIHNYALVGRLAFDDPNQMAVIFSQYSFTGNLDISGFDIRSEDLGHTLLQFALQNPSYVAGFIANHFLNTEISALLALPLIERFNGLAAPVNLYWLSWDGSLEWYNLLLVVLYMAVIAIGLGVAWHKLRWVGLTPLAFSLGYALSNGIARFSSWRYNLPADWAGYFYFGLGAIELLGGLALLLGAGATELFPPVKSSSENRVLSFRGFRRRALLLLPVFALIGSLPWLATAIVRPRYSAAPSDLVGQFVAQGQDRMQVEDFLSQPATLVAEGRLLYPRFLRRDLGLAAVHPWPAFAVRDFPRLGFVLLNQHVTQAIFSTREPLAFPHAADATILGCQRPDYVEVRLILFPASGTAFLDGPLTAPCN